MVNFHALGIKKHLLALALCTGVAIGTIAEVHATSPNHNPPSLKSNAPNVYVVKRGDIVKLLYYSYKIRKKLEITHRLSRSTILYAYV